MYKTEIKDDELVIEGVPFSKWGPKEFAMWRANTKELIEQTNRIGSLAIATAKKWASKVWTWK